VAIDLSNLTQQQAHRWFSRPAIQMRRSTFEPAPVRLRQCSMSDEQVNLFKLPIALKGAMVTPGITFDRVLVRWAGSVVTWSTMALVRLMQRVQPTPEIPMPRIAIALIKTRPIKTLAQPVIHLAPIDHCRDRVILMAIQPHLEAEVVQLC
jgi:hypothetical protein